MSWRLFWWTSRRDWRTRELRVVLAALIVAVATVSTIVLFAGHLRGMILGSASQFMAGDRQLSDARPLPEAWFAQAERFGLRQARMIEFSTMLFAGDAMQLVNVKAVDDAYPLAGQIDMQTGVDTPRMSVGKGPEPGTLWVNPRLLQLLGVAPGDEVEIGDLRLRISGILMREPDAGFVMGALAPRVMMHADDVPGTGVVQPGSRVTFRGLFSGDELGLKAFGDWLQPQLQPGHRWRGVKEGRPAVANALDRAERFLLLGGSLAVLLAALAVAVASRQYALRQQDAVALLKTLGLTGRQIGRLYAGRLVLIGVVGWVLGMLVGLPLFLLLAHIAAQVLAEAVPVRVDWLGLWPALATAAISLFAFAWPALSRVRGVPAMRVLRSGPAGWGALPWRELVIAVIGILVLLWLYAGQWSLVLALLGGVAVMLGLLWGVAALFLAGLERSARGRGVWRMALAALHRHRHASLGQMAVFALVAMLGGTLLLIRTSLLDDWQRQLPDGAPNHFLINIAAEDLPAVNAFLEANRIPSTASYPMVRGRLTRINDVPVREVVSKEQDIGALNRELNLSWTDQLPDDNRIVEGSWWTPAQREGVSVEHELATKLGLALGDRLEFTLGERTLEAQVTSIRRVQWDSMRPNFYMIFAPGALDDYPATWINSFHLQASQKPLLNAFSRQFPTVSILEVDHFIERIQSVIAQVSSAIEAILGLILAAAVLVMAAVVSATLRERRREGALLRTLGSDRRRMVQVTLIEFALLGLVSGLMGVICAEGIVWALQHRVFDGEFRMHPFLWLVVPVVSALLLAILGRWQLRAVLTVSPMRLLRALE